VQVALVLAAQQGGADSPSLIRHQKAPPAITTSTSVIAAARFALPPRPELLPATPWRISNSEPAQSSQIKIAPGERDSRCGKATVGDGAFVIHLELFEVTMALVFQMSSHITTAASIPIWVCIQG